MFKLVVLCAFLASVAAKPGGILAPLAYSSTLLEPATTSISSHSSSIIHPAPYSPYLYSSPAVGYTHFLKKRSAPFLYGSYIAPTTYATAPLVSTYSAPLVHSAPILHAPISYAHAPAYAHAHLIKKRSAPFAALPLSTAYVAPTTYAASHLYTPTTYAHAAPIYSSPIISHAPLYSHFIKKRSAPLLATTYLAPASYSTQSRVDIKHSPLITSYASHLSYPTHFAYSHLY